MGEVGGGAEGDPLGVQTNAQVDRCSVWPRMCPRLRRMCPLSRRMCSVFGRMCSVLAPRCSVRDGEGFRSAAVVGPLTGRRLGGTREADPCVIASCAECSSLKLAWTCPFCGSWAESSSGPWQTSARRRTRRPTRDPTESTSSLAVGRATGAVDPSADERAADPTLRR